MLTLGFGESVQRNPPTGQPAGAHATVHSRRQWRQWRERRRRGWRRGRRLQHRPKALQASGDGHDSFGIGVYSPCDPDASPVSVSDFGASLDPVLISQTPEYTLRRLRVPRGLALGQASVLVRNARGAVSNAIPLWIGAGRPAPMLDAVQPAQARDGQRVRLTGTGFRRVGGVLIGGGRARRVRVISSRQIVATVLGS